MTRPHVPPGTEPRVIMDAIDGSRWHVGAMEGEREVKRLSPSFTMQTEVYRYLDWIEGRVEHYDYPAGRV